MCFRLTTNQSGFRRRRSWPEQASPTRRRGGQQGRRRRPGPRARRGDNDVPGGALAASGNGLLQCPGHKTELPRCLRGGVDGVARARRNEVHHLQALALHCLAHEHVSLEEDVFLTHAGRPVRHPRSRRSRWSRACARSFPGALAMDRPSRSGAEASVRIGAYRRSRSTGQGRRRKSLIREPNLVNHYVRWEQRGTEN